MTVEQVSCFGNSHLMSNVSLSQLVSHSRCGYVSAKQLELEICSSRSRCQC